MGSEDQLFEGQRQASLFLLGYALFLLGFSSFFVLSFLTSSDAIYAAAIPGMAGVLLVNWVETRVSKRLETKQERKSILRWVSLTPPGVYGRLRSREAFREALRLVRGS